MTETSFRPAGPLIAVLAFLLAFGSPAPNAAAQAGGTILVSAAASLGGVLADLKDSFEARHPGIRLELNLGSSGALRRQIEHGAPVDVFLSASWSPVQALIDRGFVHQDDVRIFATNRVVLVRSPYAPSTLQSWEDLLRGEVRRVAIGNPSHVPAGEYGKAVLESLGLWEPLQSKLVMGEEVLQVLAFVESGGADAGVVYRTDAARARRAQVVAEAPPASRPPVMYAAAVVQSSRAPALARAFVDFLVSDDGRAILAAHGFGGPEE